MATYMTVHPRKEFSVILDGGETGEWMKIVSDGMEITIFLGPPYLSKEHILGQFRDAVYENVPLVP